MTGNSTVYLPSDPAPNGAFMRLGSYSDQEQSAHSQNNSNAYYPREHITQETAAQTVLTNAAGDLTANADYRGILLSCNGRLLLRAGEKTFIESGGTTHLDTQSDLTINAAGKTELKSGGKVTITSGTGKDIALSAGNGTEDIDITAKEYTKTIDGKSFKHVTEDSYKWTTAANFSISLSSASKYSTGSGSYSVGFAGGVHFALKIGFHANLMPSIYLTVDYLFFGFFPFCLFVQFTMLSLKQGNLVLQTQVCKSQLALVGQADVDVTAKTAEAQQSVIDVDSTDLEVEDNAVRARAKTVVVENNTVASMEG